VSKMLEPYHKVQKQELMASYVVDIVLPCETRERCFNRLFPSARLRKICELRDHDLIKLTVFITSSHRFLRTRGKVLAKVALK
jgi:hypothetical protein